MLEAADDGNGHPASLPLTSSAAAATSSAIAVTVMPSSRPPGRATPVVVERREPGDSDRRVGEPERHGRPAVSQTTTATSTPSRSRSRSRIRAGGRVGVLGQQEHGAGRVLDAVHTSCGEHEAVARLHDSRRPARATTPHRLRVDGGLAVARRRATGPPPC